MLLFLSSSTALAVEPGVCDPQEEECGCASGEELCEEADVSELISADDPLELKNAAQITSHYDESAERWIVSADVTALPASTLVVHSNNGEWESLDSLQEYISNLTGIPRNPDGSLPSFGIEQAGHVARWDAINGQWAGAQRFTIVNAATHSIDGGIDVQGMMFSDCEIDSEWDVDQQIDNANGALPLNLDAELWSWGEFANLDGVCWLVEGFTGANNSIRWNGEKTRIYSYTPEGCANCTKITWEAPLYVDEVIGRNWYIWRYADGTWDWQNPMNSHQRSYNDTPPDVYHGWLPLMAPSNWRFSQNPDEIMTNRVCGHVWVREDTSNGLKEIYGSHWTPVAGKDPDPNGDRCHDTYWGSKVLSP